MAADFLTGLAEFDGFRHIERRGSRAALAACPVELHFQLPGIAGDLRGPQRSHHLAEFRYEDAVARDRLKVVRDGAIRRDPSLENDGAIVVEEQAAHAGNDRSGLGAAGGRNHVAKGIAILELVDRGCAQHGADRRKLQGRIVVHVIGQFFDGHAQFCRHAVQKRARARGTNAAHLRHPDLHGVVEQHGFAVLSADVENGPAIGIVMRCRGNMCRHLADKGVEVHETGKVVDHLAAGDNRVRDLVSAGPGLGEKIVQGLGDGAKVAPAAYPAAPGTLQARLKLRLHPPVQMVKHLAIGRKEHCLQRGGTDVYPKKQRPIHEDTRLLTRELGGELPVGNHAEPHFCGEMLRPGSARCGRIVPKNRRRTRWQFVEPTPIGVQSLPKSYPWFPAAGRV